MIVNWINKMFDHSFKKEWFETYWAIDLHGVVFEPNYRNSPSHAKFYPWAKETLLLMKERKDIVMIMFTSSYPNEIEFYDALLIENGIVFDYINENPAIHAKHGNFGCYDKKMYFNVLLDDKAGFDPLVEWEQIYDYLLTCKKNNYLPNPDWTTKH